MGGLVPRCQTCHIFVVAIQIGLLFLHCSRCVVGLDSSHLNPSILTFGCFNNCFKLPIEPFNCLSCIVVQPTFTLNVVTKLFDPIAQRLNGCTRTALLITQRISFDTQALHNCACNSFFFTQGRQNSIMFNARLGCLTGRCFRGTCCLCAFR